MSNEKQCLSHCPKCNATDKDINWGNREVQGNYAYQNATCDKCGCMFTEEYHYAFTTIDDD